MKKITITVLCLSIFLAGLTLAPSISSARETMDMILKAIVNKDRPGENSVRLAACSPFSFNLPGPSGGNCLLTGTVCDTSGQFTFDYLNFTLFPGIQASGQIQCHILIDDPYYPTQIGFGYNGGPLHYNINGMAFTAYYQDFSINIQVGYYGFAVSNVSGGIIVNGQYIPASVELAEALFGYLFY